MPTLRIGQTIKLRPEREAEYLKIHRAVWPSVLSRIAASHIHDYSIFYDRTSHLLFATFKYTGDDFDADMAAMAADPETQRWWKETDRMQESLNEGSVGSKEGGWWRVLDEVFYVE